MFLVRNSASAATYPASKSSRVNKSESRWPYGLKNVLKVQLVTLCQWLHDSGPVCDSEAPRSSHIVWIIGTYTSGEFTQTRCIFANLVFASCCKKNLEKKWNLVGKAKIYYLAGFFSGSFPGISVDSLTFWEQIGPSLFNLSIAFITTSGNHAWKLLLMLKSIWSQSKTDARALTCRTSDTSGLTEDKVGVLLSQTTAILDTSGHRTALIGVSLNQWPQTQHTCADQFHVTQETLTDPPKEAGPPGISWLSRKTEKTVSYKWSASFSNSSDKVS